jgi:hypothetical protein
MSSRERKQMERRRLKEIREAELDIQVEKQLEDVLYQHLAQKHGQKFIDYVASIKAKNRSLSNRGAK